MLLTGIDKMPIGSTHMASRGDWPCYASTLGYLRPRRDGIPNGVMLPTYLNNGYGFSAQDAGFLGAKYAPWHIKQDPNDPKFRVDSLSLPLGMSVNTLGHRRQLLAQFNAQSASFDLARNVAEFNSYQDQAMSAQCNVCYSLSTRWHSPETGQQVHWHLKDLRKTCAT